MVKLICDSDHKVYAGNPIDQGEMEVLARIFEAKKIPFVMITENDSYINYVSDTVVETQQAFNDDVPDTGRYYGENIYQIMAFVSEKEKNLLDDLLDECDIPPGLTQALTLSRGMAEKRTGSRCFWIRTASIAPRLWPLGTVRMISPCWNMSALA